MKTELRLDLLVEGKVIVELKSVHEMCEVFWKQTLTYLRLLGLRVGILVNFNVENILDNAIFRIARANCNLSAYLTFPFGPSTSVLRFLRDIKIYSA